MLDPTAEQAFVHEMRLQFDALDLLADGRYSVVGQVPSTANVLGRINSWLGQFAGRIEIARSPVRIC